MHKNQLLACLIAVMSLSCQGGDESTQIPTAQATTVPFTLSHNRIIAEVEVIAADGSAHTASAWVDIGTESMMVAETLADDLGLDTSMLSPEARGSVASSAVCPEVRIGGESLDTTGIPLRIYPGASTQRGLQAEVHLPAGVFRDRHVVFDYPHHSLTVAAPGELEPRGAPLPCQINPETGLVMIEASIDTEAVALGVDTGSAGTWVSSDLTAAWLDRHADWPVSTGALGSTNFFGLEFEVSGILLSLPAVGVGSLTASDVAVLGLGQGLFDWYSKKSAGPVAGFLGGNILKELRLEVDWPNRMTYWEAGAPGEGRDLDIVGLTLRPEADGSYTIAGVPQRRGEPAVAGVQPGDRLLEVGPMATAGEPMGAVVDALRGSPGDRRTLVLEREGSRLTVEATVERFP